MLLALPPAMLTPESTGTQAEIEARIRIRGDSEYFQPVRDFVRRVVEASPAPATDIYHIVQAVDEALTNIIEHGYRGRAGGIIDLSIRRQGETFEIELVDDAPRFDPLAYPVPDMLALYRAGKVRGRGIHIMRSVMDELRFANPDGKRNRLTMIKRWRRPPAGAA